MKFFDKIQRKLNSLNEMISYLRQIESKIEKIQDSLGRIENRLNQNLDGESLNEYEFRVFSQGGEDGIIQYLLRNIKISRKIFVEFGVENYTECNTRFLLINNNWSGLVIDGNPHNVDYIKKDSIYWKYNLKADCAFVNRDNINNILAKNGVQDEIGILSIDVDGNDYWIWQAINSVKPAIVICEYNSRFGANKSITIPYNPNFVRTQVCNINIYYGASLKALCLLAHKKGYIFIGCNKFGNNAFFIRSDLKPDCIQELTPEEGYVAGQFRESRDSEGNLLFLSWEEEQKILFSLPLVEVD